jgi:hypothetical protein
MCWGETVGRKESSAVEYKAATVVGFLVCRALFHRLKFARAVGSMSTGAITGAGGAATAEAPPTMLPVNAWLAWVSARLRVSAVAGKRKRKREMKREKEKEGKRGRVRKSAPERAREQSSKRVKSRQRKPE